MSGFPHGDVIRLYRDGQLVTTVRGGIDPYENRLVLPPGVDVALADVAVFRGVTRRVTAEPMVWVNPFTGWQAGVMAPVEEAPQALPDLARLYRPNGVPVVNDETGELTYPQGALVWTGPVSVEPGIGQGTNTTDLAEQRISNMTHVVAVPLTCTDAMPDDVLRVYRSRDVRLVTRDLIVIGTQLTSISQTRLLLVRDNQG